MIPPTKDIAKLGPAPFERRWIHAPEHKQALMEEAEKQIDFFRASLSGIGKLDSLDWRGNAILGMPTELFVVTRLIHSYSIAKIAGVGNCDTMIDACMTILWEQHRDKAHGGYLWSHQDGTVVDGTKLAYGHVFVLLAASSAKLVGHPSADRLLTDVTTVLDQYYWDEGVGLYKDEYSRDWTVLSNYRGMNANMHAIEAMIAAYEATGEDKWLTRAGRILSFFVGEIAASHDWRIPEHYTTDWEVDAEYAGNPMFRPKGSTPGHSFELGRLLLQYWDLSGRKDPTLPTQARALIERAHADAWLPEGGYAYTLKIGGAVDIADRYWWPVTEAIGAYAALIKLDDRDEDERIYRMLWEFAQTHFIDHQYGGWFPEIDKSGQPTRTIFDGKPDIYHALQATLFPIHAGLSRILT